MESATDVSNSDKRYDGEANMTTHSSLLARILKVLGSLLPHGQSPELVKYVVVRRVPVKGRLVRVCETYYAPAESSAAAQAGDNDV